MEILNDKVLNLDSFIFLRSFYENKNNRSNISYNEFKKNLEKFAHEAMTVYLIDTPFEICVERDKKRGRTVGEAVIRKFVNRFVMPTKEEGFDEIIIVK